MKFIKKRDFLSMSRALNIDSQLLVACTVKIPECKKQGSTYGCGL